MKSSSYQTNSRVDEDVYFTRYLYHQILKYAEDKKPDSIKKLLSQNKGCFKFLISEAPVNPFIYWCDEPCSNKCPEIYESSTIKLTQSFFFKE